MRHPTPPDLLRRLSRRIEQGKAFSSRRKIWTCSFPPAPTESLPKQPPIIRETYACNEASEAALPAWRLCPLCPTRPKEPRRSEEHTSELQSLMRISYAVFCVKKKNIHITLTT